jgi:hypothetical protein
MTDLTLTDLRTAAAIVREDDQFTERTGRTSEQLTRIANGLDRLADAQERALSTFLNWRGYSVAEGENPPGWRLLCGPDDTQWLLAPDGVDPDHVTHEQALTEAVRIVAERLRITPPSGLLDRDNAVSLLADNYGGDLIGAMTRHFHITDIELGLPF